MLEKIINFTKKFNMLLPDITVVVGLSGGADSICLTTVLNELSHNIGFKLEAVHVNHNLRNAPPAVRFLLQSACPAIPDSAGIWPVPPLP